MPASIVIVISAKTENQDNLQSLKHLRMNCSDFFKSKNSAFVNRKTRHPYGWRAVFTLGFELLLAVRLAFSQVRTGNQVFWIVGFERIEDILVMHFKLVFLQIVDLAV